MAFDVAILTVVAASEPAAAAASDFLAESARSSIGFVGIVDGISSNGIGCVRFGFSSASSDVEFVSGSGCVKFGFGCDIICSGVGEEKSTSADQIQWYRDGFGGGIDIILLGGSSSGCVILLGEEWR